MAKILVIDDVEQIRLVLGEMLRATGNEVIAAANGAEGVELFQRQTFDLVITDMLMPKKGGDETIAALRSLQPGIKIIAVYGGLCPSDLDSQMADRRAQADRFLAKPLTMAELQTAVSEVLGMGPGNPEHS